MLVCGLSYVIILQYLITVLRFGPELAGRHLRPTIFISYLVVALLAGQFSSIKRAQAQWLPIFRVEKKRKQAATP
jgi:hypothetical protein